MKHFTMVNFVYVNPKDPHTQTLPLWNDSFCQLRGTYLFKLLEPSVYFSRPTKTILGFYTLIDFLPRNGNTLKYFPILNNGYVNQERRLAKPLPLLSDLECHCRRQLRSRYWNLLLFKLVDWNLVPLETTLGFFILAIRVPIINNIKELVPNGKHWI